MGSTGAGVASVEKLLVAYVPTIGKDVLLVIGAFIVMGFGVALFRKGVQWFRGLVH